MESFLRDLVRFQDLSLEISRLDARISKIPGEIRLIDAEEKSASEAVDHAKDRFDTSQKERRDAEAKLQDLELKKDKYNDQSSQVKTNEQYRAIMHEIEGVKAQIGQVEEKILLAMEEADELEGSIREAEKSFQEHKKEFAARRKVLLEEKQRLEEERKRVDSERESLSGKIPSAAMEAYERVASARGELVVARAMDQRCQVCNVRLRPQIYSEIRRNDRIINCESCTRILYYIDEPAEKKPEGKEDSSGPPPSDSNGPAPSTGPDPA